MNPTLAIAIAALILLIVAAVLLGPARSEETPAITLMGVLCAICGLAAMAIAAIRSGAPT